MTEPVTIEKVREVRQIIEDAINKAIESAESITGCRVVIYQHMPIDERSGKVEVEVKL